MGPELQDIVEEAGQLLGQPTTLKDRQFNLIAFAAQYSPLDAVRQNSILHRRQPRSRIRLTRAAWPSLLLT